MTSNADSNTLTDTGGRTMTWDSQNCIASCTYSGKTSAFAYGMDGLRKSEIASGVITHCVYDGQTLTREMHKNTRIKF